MLDPQQLVSLAAHIQQHRPPIFMMQGKLLISSLCAIGSMVGTSTSYPTNLLSHPVTLKKMKGTNTAESSCSLNVASHDHTDGYQHFQR